MYQITITILQQLTNNGKLRYYEKSEANCTTQINYASLILAVLDIACWCDLFYAYITTFFLFIYSNSFKRCERSSWIDFYFANNMEQMIKITHVQDPYQFWFKFEHQNDINEALELEIAEYVEKSKQCEKIVNVSHLNVGDYVAAHFPENNTDKWLRGRIKAKNRMKNTLTIWLIDDGCEIQVEPNCVMPLERQLATNPISNVYIGGLCDARPAAPVSYLYADGTFIDSEFNRMGKLKIGAG